jgi:ketosteroid isomerase-like protein
MGAMAGNTDLLRRFYDAWNREGLDAFETLAELTAPDVEFTEPPDFPDGGTHHGVEEWRAAMARQLEGWQQIEFEPDEFVESGDRILAAVRARTLGRATDIETERLIFHVVTIGDGRVLRWHVFFDREAALKDLETGALES